MSRQRLYTLTQAGEMLGLSRQAMAEIVDRMGITTTSQGLPGRGRYLSMPQIRKVARALGIEIRPLVTA